MNALRKSLTLIALAIPYLLSAQCNGEKNLCYKRYNDVSFLISNNAFTPFEGMMVGDQSRSIEEQLAAGVDGLALNVDMYLGEPVVYYKSAILGHRPLKEVLGAVEDQLRSDRELVLTLVLDSKVPSHEWSAELKRSGAAKFLYAHSDELWPTLRQMIDDNERLVVITNNASPEDKDLVNDVDALAKRTKTDLCEQECPEKILGSDDSYDLLIMDHHSELKVSEKIDDIAWINSREVLLKRGTSCWNQTGMIPNLILVDHFDIGDAKESIRIINNITDGLAENVDPRNFEISSDPVMEFSTIDFRGYIKKDHTLEIWEEEGIQVASVENVQYAKMYIPKMALAFGSYRYRVLDPENTEIDQGNFQIN